MFINTFTPLFYDKLYRRKEENMQKQTWQLVAIGLGIIIVGSLLGYWSLTTEPPADYPCAVCGQTFDTQAELIAHTETVHPGVTPTVYEAAAMKFSVHNMILGNACATTGTGYLDVSIVDNGIWNPLKKYEGPEWDADPDTSTLTYNYGDEVVLHISNNYDFSGANETYDRWFYVTLIPGEPIRELIPGVLTATQTNPYKYQISGTGPDTGQKVQYIAGTTPYWGLGALEVYPRAGKQHVDLSLRHAGTTLASVTDGSTWITTAYNGGSGNQTADATFASATEDLFLDIISSKTDVCFGLPQYILGSNGEFKEYRSVAVIASNGTAIGVTSLTEDGWIPVNKVDITASAVFYKVLDPLIPQRGKKFSTSLEITVDASGLSSSTAYCMKAWVLDIQLPSNVAIGTTSATVPTVYGMMTALGCTTPIHARALTVSGGAAATWQLFCDFTTA